MAYRYLDEITRADVAFEASGETLEEFFDSAARATLGVMVRDLETVKGVERIQAQLTAEGASLEQAAGALLHDFLEKLLFFKDSEGLLLKPVSLRFTRAENGLRLDAGLAGERAAPDRHELQSDVKAVTHHRFRVSKDHLGWSAVVVLDV